MPVTLNIIADSAAELVDEFRKLNALTTPVNDNPVTRLNVIPLDALVEQVRERLREDGFKLEIIDQRDPAPVIDLPVQEPAPKTPAKGKGKKAPTETEPEPSSGEPSKAEPPPSDPEADRQNVMDTLGALAQKSKLKAKVFEFAGRLAKQNGKDKLSELASDPFPAIRKAMETEFADVLPAALSP